MTEPDLDPRDHLPPWDQKTQPPPSGYVVLENATGAELFPKQTCSWGRRRLAPGENVVNRNLLDDWSNTDPDFAALLESGKVQILRTHEPVAETVRANELGAGAATAEVAALRAKVETLAEIAANQQAQLASLLASGEGKKGK